MRQEELEQVIEEAIKNRYSRLNLSGKQLNILPESINKLTNLYSLDLSCNQLTSVPENICTLTSLNCLDLCGNQLDRLPVNIGNLRNLKSLDLSDNPLIDLSALNKLSLATTVYFLGVNLSRRYWTKISDWDPVWLLEEDNSEVRSILVEQVGYEKICQSLDAIKLNSWREYTLLRIDGIQDIYDYCGDHAGTEPTLLLKMTCPSTQHIHILRVPPEMTSAESAITWVNHGIHPDKFAVQT